MRLAIPAWQWVTVVLLYVMTTLHGQRPLALPSALAPFVAVNAPIVALTHVRVVDGTGAPERLDQTVVLDGMRIAAVRGNPLRAPTAIYDVVTVFRDGVGFDSVKLRAAARGKVGLN